jgi:tRNA-2-methylthio-N6-dimethylallyladenosine synthase
MNWSDSERIAGYFNKNNFKQTDFISADFVILNLCSVRQSAINRVWGVINNLSKIKKPIIILTGCILPSDRKKLAKKVDYILDIKDLNNWINYILLSSKTKRRDSSTSLVATRFGRNDTKKTYFSITPNHNSKHTAYIPIMTGCNNFCSYCVVPYTRGREISRPAKDIISEVNKLVVQGYKHIILLGQNVNSYQSKISNFQFPISNEISKSKLQKNKINFSQLLKLVDSISGNYWLSFMTSHPKDMSDELIKCFSKCEHIIPYLHLPIQSGSDKILKAMNRKYTTARYINLIRKIRRVISNISISTDIIVGFPGETKKDFQATANLMKKIKFDMAYLAKYSPRSGTSAYKLKDDISEKEKSSRHAFLNEILKKTALGNNKKMVGKITEVLIEKVLSASATTVSPALAGSPVAMADKLKNKDIILFGKTKNYKDIKIKVKKQKLARHSFSEGELIKIKIIKANSWNLEGKIIK